MKNNKGLLLALLIALIIVLGIWLVNRSNLLEQEPIDSPNSQELVADYLTENISALSPEPEVLGGTFYVTGLEFLDEQSAKVDYEDGHIALSAVVRYFINNNNEVIITDFSVLPEEYVQEQFLEEEVLITELSPVEVEALVGQYIRDNISTLSPEPEVLGGTFYVTNLEFLDEQSVKVDYEDGHIDLEALANYSLDNGLVTIYSFEIID